MADSTNNNTNEEVLIETVEGISKAGNPYKALEIHVGEYTARVFPTKIELMYIEHILDKK